MLLCEGYRLIGMQQKRCVLFSLVEVEIRASWEVHHETLNHHSGVSLKAFIGIYCIIYTAVTRVLDLPSRGVPTIIGNHLVFILLHQENVLVEENCFFRSLWDDKVKMYKSIYLSAQAPEAQVVATRGCSNRGIAEVATVTTYRHQSRVLTFTFFKYNYKNDCNH